MATRKSSTTGGATRVSVAATAMIALRKMSLLSELDELSTELYSAGDALVSAGTRVAELCGRRRRRRSGGTRATRSCPSSREEVSTCTDCVRYCEKAGLSWRRAAAAPARPFTALSSHLDSTRARTFAARVPSNHEHQL